MKSNQYSFDFYIVFIFYALVFSVVFLLQSCKHKNESIYNFSFEILNEHHKPKDWFLSSVTQEKDYDVNLDSLIVENGKYSLSIKRINSNNKSFGGCTYLIPAKYKGKKIKLSGYIKTKNVTDGIAGLWLRVDGKQKVLSFDNMQDRGIQGTTAWHEYTIELPYYQDKAKQIVLGALLTGKGEMWVDNLHVYIDGKPLELASLKKPTIDKDSLYENSSQILSINLNGKNIKLLTNLGMIWGFLKYYHPAVISGKYNWDAELFKHLPQILEAANQKDAYKIIEQWIDSLGIVPACNSCSAIPPNKIKLKPDYGYLFAKNNLPASLERKLAFLRDNYKSVDSSYYISFVPGVGNPKFKNELNYTAAYPDAGIRLLALYRYWNIIQYFFPYRYSIDEDWNKVLSEFIPIFVNAKDVKEYTLACLKIIANIHDTHANISNYNPILDTLKGIYMTPFQAKFIENKLVVTNFYKDTLNIKNKIHIGDIIEEIDGVSVQSLIKKYLPLTPGSNYKTQLRDLSTSQGFLLRSNKPTLQLLIKRTNNHESLLSISRIPVQSIDCSIDFMDINQTSGYKMLSNNIGYIYPAKLNDFDINSIKKEFSKTKGIIIDMRCYPSTFMVGAYGNWLKNISSPFVKIAKVNATLPGSVTWSDTVSNGSANYNYYKGKVVIIANALAQSSAEYQIMALSTAPNAIVIGGTTAGADGNVSSITLPGGISTYISALGVYYPDNTETQHVGIKIDLPVTPTINGIREKRDELLEKAIEIIKKQ